MKLKVVVHEAEEGGYWVEVPAIPGCATQAESFEELLSNLYEAVEGCLSVDVRNTHRYDTRREPRWTTTPTPNATPQRDQWRRTARRHAGAALRARPAA